MTVALGTFLTVEGALAGRESDAQRAFEQARAAFETVAAVMHPRAADGDPARIAHARPGERVRVHAWTAEVLRLSRRVWQSTGGLFDPCLPEAPGRLNDLEVIERSAVVLRGPRIALDLGGIAKGHAVDRAVEALQAAGCIEGLVNAGGDVRVFGEAAQTFLIRLHGGGALHIALGNEALAVSEPRTDASPPEHRGFYSPLTGQEISGRAIAVRAPTAAVADALTKCAMLCPPDRLAAVLREYEASLVELPAETTEANPPS